MATIPPNYKPNTPRLLPEGNKRVLVVDAKIEKDQYDKDKQREVVVMKVKILGSGEPDNLYTKFFRLPINWTVPGTTETNKANIIGGKMIWTMLQLIGAASTGSDVDVSPLEGQQFVWSIAYKKVPPEPEPGKEDEQKIYPNIKNIALPGGIAVDPPQTPQQNAPPASGDYSPPFDSSGPDEEVPF
jgi:hypothetical protein